MTNRLFTFLLLVLVTVPASAAEEYWTAKRYEIAKRDLALEKMYTRYEIERMTTPPGATIPKNKSLTVPYTKSRIVDLARNAKKATAVNLAIIAAIEAAGWAIDEVTKDVTETTYDTPPEYDSSGYYRTFGTNDYASWSADLACKAYQGPNGVISFTGGYTQGKPNYYCSGPQPLKTTTWVRCTDPSASLVICEAPPPSQPTTVLVPDPTVVDQVAPYLDGLPDYSLDDIFADERGIPIMTPELKGAINDYNQDLADADPNLSWDPGTGEFTYTDPTTQDQTSWGADPAVTEDTDTSASDKDALGSEWPDFCDWTVGAGFCETEPEEQPTYQPVIDAYDGIKSDVGAVETPLPTLWSFPVAFQGAGACQGLTFDFDRKGLSMHFVWDKHCEIAATIINPVLAWLFALLTVWFCMETYREETMRGF